ncbi:hypothetical protein C8R47DRAFT_1120604 [Mycena vitilis]|nr:hypothetical protein C8R47DRAFT_1120604 [Mycena vitilis]
MARDTSHLSRFSIMRGTNLPVPESAAAQARRLARQQPRFPMRARSPTTSPTPAPRVALRKTMTAKKPAETQGTDVLRNIGNTPYPLYSEKTTSMRKITSRVDSRLEKALATKRAAGVGARSSTRSSTRLSWTREQLARSAMVATGSASEPYKSTAGEEVEDGYSAANERRIPSGIALLAQISGLVMLAHAAVDSPKLPSLRRM